MRISDWSSDVCSSDLLGRVSGAIDWRVGRREPSAGFAGLSASQGGTGVEAVRSGFVPRIRIGEWQKKAFLQCAILSHPYRNEPSLRLWWARLYWNASQDCLTAIRRRAPDRARRRWLDRKGALNGRSYV